MMTKKFIWFLSVVYSLVLIGADKESRYQGPPIQVIPVKLSDGSKVHPYKIPARYRPARITTATFVEVVVEDMDKDRGTP